MQFSDGRTDGLTVQRVDLKNVCAHLKFCSEVIIQCAFRVAYLASEYPFTHLDLTLFSKYRPNSPQIGEFSLYLLNRDV